MKCQGIGSGTGQAVLVLIFIDCEVCVVFQRPVSGNMCDLRYRVLLFIGIRREDLLDHDITGFITDILRIDPELTIERELISAQTGQCDHWCLLIQKTACICFRIVLVRDLIVFTCFQKLCSFIQAQIKGDRASGINDVFFIRHAACPDTLFSFIIQFQITFVVFFVLDQLFRCLHRIGKGIDCIACCEAILERSCHDHCIYRNVQRFTVQIAVLCFR